LATKPAKGIHISLDPLLGLDSGKDEYALSNSQNKDLQYFQEYGFRIFIGLYFGCVFP
jgi:hypothetical protein